jgi:hypothetical protein
VSKSILATHLNRTCGVWRFDTPGEKAIGTCKAPECRCPIVDLSIDLGGHVVVHLRFLVHNTLGIRRVEAFGIPGGRSPNGSQPLVEGGTRTIDLSRRVRGSTIQGIVLWFLLNQLRSKV